MVEDWLKLPNGDDAGGDAGEREGAGDRRQLFVFRTTIYKYSPSTIPLQRPPQSQSKLDGFELFVGFSPTRHEDIHCSRRLVHTGFLHPCMLNTGQRTSENSIRS